MAVVVIVVVSTIGTSVGVKVMVGLISAATTVQVGTLVRVARVGWSEWVSRWGLKDDGRCGSGSLVEGGKRGGWKLAGSKEGF